MKRTSSRCPGCRSVLVLCCDMWGLYYLCEDCGWTAEDDDLLDAADRPALGRHDHLIHEECLPASRWVEWR